MSRGKDTQATSCARPAGDLAGSDPLSAPPPVPLNAPPGDHLPSRREARLCPLPLHVAADEGLNRFLGHVVRALLHR